LARLAHLLALAAGERPSTRNQSHADDLSDNTSDVNTDAGDFRAFYEQHQRDIFGYLWRMTGDEQAAHDLTQETFLRAWHHFDQIRAYEQPRAWLFRIATHLALNHRRDEAVRQRPLPAPEPMATTREWADDIALRDTVRANLLALPARERAALVLHVIYGMTCAELAATLGISPGAAKTTLWRARERFRARYNAEETSHDR
jgi:RNA polymerase sigma-70 factor (ECF subfamily)